MAPRPGQTTKAFARNEGQAHPTRTAKRAEALAGWTVSNYPFLQSIVSQWLSCADGAIRVSFNAGAEGQTHSIFSRNKVSSFSIARRIPSERSIINGTQ